MVNVPWMDWGVALAEGSGGVAGSRMGVSVGYCVGGWLAVVVGGKAVTGTTVMQAAASRVTQTAVRRKMNRFMM
jgi:hypothetical protein